MLPLPVWDNLDKLEEIRKMAARTGIFSDLDGTLSEIASTPEEAFVDSEMKLALSALTSSYGEVVVISGRSLKAIKAMLSQEGLTYFGNHGLEILSSGGYWLNPRARRFSRWLKESKEELIAHLLKIDIHLSFEDKDFTFAVHYRLASSPQDAEAKILSILTPLILKEKFSLIKGRKVIEIRPPFAHKGQAVLKFVREKKLEGILYLGDDLTDLDAFKVVQKLKTQKEIKGYTIVIFSSETPLELKEKADFFLTSVAEVKKFFSWLAS